MAKSDKWAYTKSFRRLALGLWVGRSTRLFHSTPLRTVRHKLTKKGKATANGITYCEQANWLVMGDKHPHQQAN